MDLAHFLAFFLFRRQFPGHVLGGSLCLVVPLSISAPLAGCGWLHTPSHSPRVLPFPTPPRRTLPQCCHLRRSPPQAAAPPMLPPPFPFGWPLPQCCQAKQQRPQHSTSPPNIGGARRELLTWARSPLAPFESRHQAPCVPSPAVRMIQRGARDPRKDEPKKATPTAGGESVRTYRTDTLSLQSKTIKKRLSLLGL